MTHLRLASLLVAALAVTLLVGGRGQDTTIWRAQLDGTQPEALVTGHGNIELVGIALDVEKGHVYFSDKTTKKIFRTAMALPPGQTSADRTDIERLVKFPDAAMPSTSTWTWSAGTCSGPTGSTGL